jgi:D-lactate dehydrogenase (cytochrome)
MLSDGTLLELQRGRDKVGEDGKFTIGGSRDVKLPEVQWPDTKNAAGYHLKPGMDLLDLFIGSEGTLGVIVELELVLVPAPASTAEVVVLQDSEEKALDLAEVLRDSALDVASVEFLCPRALKFLEGKGKLTGFEIRTGDTSAVILSLEAGPEVIEPQLKMLTALLHDKCADPLDTLVALDAGDKERFRVFRHSLPESINETIAQVKTQHPEVTKLGMDFAVPLDRVREMVALYHEKLDGLGLEYVLFGHVGNGHVHVNLIPYDMDQYRLGSKVYRELARDAVDLGGTVSGEHGIGKLKKDLLLMMYGEDGVGRMRAVKEALDPTWTLGQGTLFYLRGEIEECGK